jgi:NADH-quinone oxidoreductase subunit K
MLGSLTPMHIMIFSVILFTIGVIGVLVRRNAIIIFMSIELMLNAANINLIGFSRFLPDLTGQIFAVFVICVAAGEVAVGLAILIALYRNKETVNVDEINLMKW